MEGIAEMIPENKEIEATFPDGTKLYCIVIQSGERFHPKPWLKPQASRPVILKRIITMSENELL